MNQESHVLHLPGRDQPILPRVADQFLRPEDDAERLGVAAEVGHVADAGDAEQARGDDPVVQGA